MPYEHEFANPNGYRSLLENEFLVERLQTFSLRKPIEDQVFLYELLDPVPAAELADPDIKYSDLKQAVGIDGSVVRNFEDDVSSSFEIAALKIGMAIQDVHAFNTAKELHAPMTPEVWDSIYHREDIMAILSGKGVYGDKSDNWTDKAKEELYINLKSIIIPGTSVTLLEAFTNIVLGNRTFLCPECLKQGKEVAIDYAMFPNGDGECFSCGTENLYITDFLMDYYKNSSFSTSIMLLMERILMAALIRETSEGNTDFNLNDTMFVLDGPLALFRLNQVPFNSFLLDDAQDYLGQRPLLMAIEKTGAVSDFAHTPEVQDRLLPGHVAMLTTEFTQVLEGKRSQDVHTKQFYYGKKFLYRTLDGDKTFVFMVVPIVGSPYRTKEDLQAAEDYVFYPDLKLYCEYIEQTATNRFGISNAALDIISEANYAASLPKTLSMRYLAELVSENVQL